MNPSSSPLDRLLKAAAQAPHKEQLASLPFPAEARVLAAWRSSRSENLTWAARWLQAGLATAALTAVLALVMTWSSIRPDPQDEYAVANATLYVAVAQ